MTSSPIDIAQAIARGNRDAIRAWLSAGHTAAEKLANGTPVWAAGIISDLEGGELGCSPVLLAGKGLSVNIHFDYGGDLVRITDVLADYRLGDTDVLLIEALEELLQPHARESERLAALMLQNLQKKSKGLRL